MKKLYNMKNQYLRAAIAEVCKKEGIKPSIWADKTVGISHSQIAKLSNVGLRDEALQALCKESNWKYPASSLELTVAILNDMIVRVGRSPEEFNVHPAKNNQANIPMEEAIRKIEEFASRSSGAFELIQNIAMLVANADKLAAAAANGKTSGVSRKKSNPMRHDGFAAELEEKISKKLRGKSAKHKNEIFD